MDKIDMIYDTVCRLEEKTDKRLEALEKDICNIKEYKNKLLGIIGCLSVIGTIVVDFIKRLIFG